jgi:hypothetical protein
MFENLVRPGQTIAQNVASQLTLYAAPGDAVIAVFQSLTTGQSRNEILANSTAIRAAMLAEVLAQGPISVSKHCADPSVISALDVGKSAFNSTTGLRFVSSVQPRCTQFWDEPAPNNAFHLQKDL